MDSGATDHLTSDLERLHVHARYGGKDQVQVANGAGLSISHIGHSSLAGSSLKLNNVLHVPHLSKHLLSVYRLVRDNDVFVEFHRHFFVLRTRSQRKRCFSVEIRMDSTLSRLVALPLLHLVMLVLPPLLNGICVLVTPPIM